jgi:hypothetical protein
MSSPAELPMGLKRTSSKTISTLNVSKNGSGKLFAEHISGSVPKSSCETSSLYNMVERLPVHNSPLSELDQRLAELIEPRNNDRIPVTEGGVICRQRKLQNTRHGSVKFI